MYLQPFNFQLSALTNRRQAADNLKQKLMWRWVPLAGVCAVLFTAWSPNGHSRPVSQRLLWAQRTWWLTLQTFQVPFAMCSNNVFISCCLLNTGLAWVSPSRPFSSDLQAFSRSQRRPNAARAGAGPAERLQQNLGGGWEGDSSTVRSLQQDFGFSPGHQMSPAEQRTSWNPLLSSSLLITSAANNYHLFLEAAFALFMNYLI